MSDRNLRASLIRLAYQNPNLRSALLPLIKKRASDGDDMAAVLEAEADPTSHDQNLPEHYYYGKTSSKKGSKTSGEREVLRHGSLRAEWEYNSGTTRIYQVYDAQEGAVVGRLLWDKRANSWEVEVADPNSGREWSRVSYFSSPDAREGVKRGLALLEERA